MTAYDTVEQPHRDTSAWGSLIETLESGTLLGAISASMSQKLKQQYTIEDIWQETLFMAWRDGEQHEWTGIRSYRAWVLSIARNRIRDAVEHAGAKKRGGDITINSFSALAPGDDDSIGRLLPPGSTTPSRVAAHAERIHAMEEALNSLPNELRDVVRLSLFDELPIREVAVHTGASESTVKRRLLDGATRYRLAIEERLGDDKAQVTRHR